MQLSSQSSPTIPSSHRQSSFLHMQPVPERVLSAALTTARFYEAYATPSLPDHFHRPLNSLFFPPHLRRETLLLIFSFWRIGISPSQITGYETTGHATNSGFSDLRNRTEFDDGLRVYIFPRPDGPGHLPVVLDRDHMAVYFFENGQRHLLELRFSGSEFRSPILGYQRSEGNPPVLVTFYVTESDSPFGALVLTHTFGSDLSVPISTSMSEPP